MTKMSFMERKENKTKNSEKQTEKQNIKKLN